MIRTQCKKPRTNSVVQVYIDQTLSSSVLKVNKNKNVIIQTIEEESISNNNNNNYNNSNNNRNYLKLKTIKSLIDQNISLNQLAPNINLLDDKIDKECLLTIISKGNEFTFCKKSKLNTQKTKENRSRSVIEDRNIDNLLNKRIYDFNSMKSSTKKNIDEEEMFLPFLSLKAKSAREKEVNSINAYKNLQEENYTILDVCHNSNRFINRIVMVMNITKTRYCYISRIHLRTILKTIALALITVLLLLLISKLRLSHQYLLVI